MRLQDQLTLAHAKAAKVFLQYQEIEGRIQALQIAKTQLQQDMMKSDGEVELLERLIVEEKKNA